MSISAMSASSTANLACLKQALSVAVLDKSLNRTASDMGTLLSDFKQNNPAPPSSGRLDTYA